MNQIGTLPNGMPVFAMDNQSEQEASSPVSPFPLRVQLAATAANMFYLTSQRVVVANDEVKVIDRKLSQAELDAYNESLNLLRTYIRGDSDGGFETERCTAEVRDENETLQGQIRKLEEHNKAMQTLIGSVCTAAGFQNGQFLPDLVAHLRAGAMANGMISSATISRDPVAQQPASDGAPPPPADVQP